MFPWNTVMSSSPYQLPNLQITQILTTQPFLHAKSCLWDQCLFLYKVSVEYLTTFRSNWFLLHNQKTFMNSCFPQPLGNQFPSRNLCPCTIILTYQVSLKELCVIKYKCPCLMIKDHVEFSTSFLQGCVYVCKIT